MKASFACPVITTYVHMVQITHNLNSPHVSHMCDTRVQMKKTRVASDHMYTRM